MSLHPTDPGAALPVGSLEDRLVRGWPAREEALSWVARAAATIDAAHAVGIVHGDLTPRDLVLYPSGRLEVAGLGAARAPGTASAPYTAPERARGKPATPAGDVYSLAAVAAELLSGRRPPEGRAARRPLGISPGIDAVLVRGLARDPAERHSSARAFAADLLDAAGHAAWATAVMPPASSPRRADHRRFALRLLAGVGVAVAIAGVATAVGTMASGGDRDDARAVVTLTTTRTAAAPPPRTVVETITRPAPVAPTPPVVPSAPDDTAPLAPPPGDPVALTDQSTAALEDGAATEGLALADQALRSLAGTGEPYEANASYNRGRALIDLGRCDEAVPALERSVALGGSEWQMGVRRAALDEARAC